VPLPLGSAIAAYYRSQFLNGALPGGVLGDVHRGVRHGDAGDLGRGLAASAVCVIAAVLVVPILPQHGSARIRTGRQAVASDLRAGVTAPAVWPGVVGCSVVALAGHVATFLIAARAARSRMPIARLLPFAMLVLLAAALPMNIGGWGPREGGAAWVFSLAGLGAVQGVGTGTTYGMLASAASLPGAVPLAGWMTRRTHRTTPTAHTVVARRR
jgi:glycosyltransferase 2 family protein